MKDRITHVFFDLDRTLWDFEKSALQAFEKIYDKFNLKKLGVTDVEAFHEAYTVHNDRLWDKYRKGQITKDVLRGKRFALTLKDFGIIDIKLGELIGDEYVRISPLIVNLFPNSEEVIEYLAPKYNLHIITNGFSEVQFIKLKSAGLDKYFDKVITSEEAGAKKPDPIIFDYALEKAGAEAKNSVMIGDDYEVDIMGARDVGIDQIFFDPEDNHQENGKCTYHINDLKEIIGIL